MSKSTAVLHPPWYHPSKGYPSVAISLSVPLKTFHVMLLSRSVSTGYIVHS